MCPRREFPGVREIHILRDEKSFFRLRRRPNFTVWFTGETFFARRLDTMTELLQNWNDVSRDVLVQLNLHRTCGVAGMGRSSSADAAANAIAAWTSAACREG